MPGGIWCPCIPSSFKPRKAVGPVFSLPWATNKQTKEGIWQDWPTRIVPGTFAETTTRLFLFSGSLPWKKILEVNPVIRGENEGHTQACWAELRGGGGTIPKITPLEVTGPVLPGVPPMEFSTGSLPELRRSLLFFQSELNCLVSATQCFLLPVLNKRLNCRNCPVVHKQIKLKISWTWHWPRIHLDRS